MFQTHLDTGGRAGPNYVPKIRIVIVEKHEAVRRALHKRLNASPHLDVIASVQESSAVLPYLSSTSEPTSFDQSPDVVLLGLRDGPDEALFDTLDIIQQIVHCSAAVIVLTPYADEFERLLLQQAGVSSYLLKYIDSPLLIQEIEAAARRGRDPITGI